MKLQITQLDNQSESNLQVSMDNNGVIQIEGEESEDLIKLKKFFNLAQKLISDNESLYEEVQNIRKKKLDNGIERTPRENNLFKGAGIHLISFLLETTDTFCDYNIHFTAAQILLDLMKDKEINFNSNKTLAVTALYIFVPLMRLYESAEILGALQDTALSILDSDLIKASKLKQLELLGINPNSINTNVVLETITGIITSYGYRVRGNFRKKSDLSFLLKYHEGRDWRDLFAMKFVIYSEEKVLVEQDIINIINSLQERGIIVDRITNTFKNPRIDDPNYKVYNLKVTIPSDFYSKDSNTPSIPFELRFSLENYDPTHSGYKMYEQVDPRMGEHKQDAIVIARALQNNLHGIPLSSLNKKDQSNLHKIRTKSRESLMLYTGRANNIIFVSKISGLHSQIRQFSNNLFQSGVYADIFTVIRYEYNNGIKIRQEFEVFIQEDNTKVYSHGEDTVEEKDFKLQDTDAIIKGRTSERQLGNFLTINDILNLISLSPTPDHIPFDEILVSYVNINEEILRNIWFYLQYLNKRQSLPELSNDISRADHSSIAFVSNQFEKFINLFKKQLIRKEVVEIIKNGDLEKIKFARTSMRRYLSNIILSEIADDIENNIHFDEVMNILFNIEDFANDIKSWISLYNKFNNHKVWRQLKIAKYIKSATQSKLKDSDKNIKFKRSFSSFKGYQVFGIEIES